MRVTDPEGRQKMAAARRAEYLRLIEGRRRDREKERAAKRAGTWLTQAQRAALKAALHA